MALWTASSSASRTVDQHLGGQFDADAQPSTVAVRESNLSSVFARNRSGDAEAESYTTITRIARRLQPIERCKDSLLLFHWNARTIVCDHNDDPLVFANNVNASRTAIFDSIVDEIGYGAS